MYFNLICGADKTSIITPTDEPSPFSSKVFCMKLSWFSFSTKTFCQVRKEEQAALHSQCRPRLRRHQDPTLERSRLQRQVVWKYFVNKNNMGFFCPDYWNFVHLNVELHRHEGAYYDTGWRAAVKAQPSIVSITSFNEWGEGTQVLKRKKFHSYIAKWKNSWTITL